MSSGPRAFPDHFISIYQSAVEELARDRAKRLPEANGPETETKGLDFASAMNAAAAELGALRMHGRVYSPQGEQKSIGTVMTCASLGLKYMEALIKGDEVAARAIEGKLSDAKCDPGWASTLGEYYSSYLGADGARRPIPYRRAATVGPAVITI